LLQRAHRLGAERRRRPLDLQLIVDLILIKTVLDAAVGRLRIPAQGGEILSLGLRIGKGDRAGRDGCPGGARFLALVKPESAGGNAAGGDPDRRLALPTTVCLRQMGKTSHYSVSFKSG